jgi:hypothetical protein
MSHKGSLDFQKPNASAAPPSSSTTFFNFPSHTHPNVLKNKTTNGDKEMLDSLLLLLLLLRCVILCIPLFLCIILINFTFESFQFLHSRSDFSQNLMHGFGSS